MPNPENSIYQIKISLIGANPPIWRRVLIHPATTLQDLHRIIQLAMGWQGYHLHLFQTPDGRLIGDPSEDDEGTMNFDDEARVTVSSLLSHEGEKLSYEYDFGDSWLHEIALEKRLPPTEAHPLPRCIKAVRQCPPEDVGGLGGFYEFLEAMEDAAHPEHVAVRDWLGEDWFEPEFVDLQQINENLANREALFADDRRPD